MSPTPCLVPPHCVPPPVASQDDARPCMGMDASVGASPRGASRGNRVARTPHEMSRCACARA
eukprot:5096613-Prymnesium_polylepis.1